MSEDSREEKRSGSYADPPAHHVPDSDVVVDFSRYLPTVLSRLVSRLRAKANAFLQTTYGLNLLEWRVISDLASHGPTSAYAIWTEGGLDKAAVSRTLRSLKARGLVDIADGATRGPRRRTSIALTDRGRALQEQTLSIIIARHARLVSGISADDLEAFLRTAVMIGEGVDLMASDTDADPQHFPITKQRTD